MSLRQFDSCLGQAVPIWSGREDSFVTLWMPGSLFEVF